MTVRKPNALEKFIEYRALAVRFQNDPLEEAVSQSMENTDELDGVKLANICFKDSQAFAEQITRVAKELGISKRVFMKRAIIHAMDMAEEAMDRALDDWPETDEDEATNRGDVA
jgi:hypothetical protein